MSLIKQETILQIDADALMARAEDYSLRIVPVGGLEIVAGVDTQEKHWAVGIWAIGHGDEMWMVDYQEIEGNPADERDWDKLHNYLQQPLQHMSGPPVKVDAVAVDTAGHYTVQASKFCEENKDFNYYGIKGRIPREEVREYAVQRGLGPYIIVLDDIKDELLKRIQVEKPGPGYVHLTKQLPEKFFVGISGEVRKLTGIPVNSKPKWIKRIQNVEPLDVTLQAMFASEMLHHKDCTAEQWAQMGRGDA